MYFGDHKSDFLLLYQTHINKKDDNKSHHLFYGAPDGLISEPHPDIISIIDNIECQELERKIQKLMAA